MTVYTKILVFLNFALSVMALAWAFLFYSNRVDWTEGTATEPGELRARKARVAELWDGLRTADLGWRASRDDVLEREGYRAADRPWFDAELVRARSGATVMNPVRTVVYKANGELDLVPANPARPNQLRPKLVPAQDDKKQNLASLDSIRKEEQLQLAQWVAAQAQLHALIQELTALTEKLTPESGPGLRQRIEDEKVEIKRVDEELAIVRPLLVNTYVEAELILRRRQQLEARLKELSAGLGVASGAN